jgi:hypothetical protein
MSRLSSALLLWVLVVAAAIVLLTACVDAGPGYDPSAPSAAQVMQRIRQMPVVNPLGYMPQQNPYAVTRCTPDYAGGMRCTSSQWQQVCR